MLLTGNGPERQERQVGLLHRRRPADPRARGLPVRAEAETTPGEPRRRQGAARPAAHPGVPAADPVHAQDRDLPGQRLGGRRRAQPARGLRPDPGQRASTRAFKQTDADVGSFDGGFGSAYLARQVGQKFAREIFFLGDEYSAEDAHRMGMVNRVVPHAELEREALEWGRKINGKSPTAQRMLKYSFNLIDDGLVGQQLFAGETTRLAYMTDEAVEGRDQFLEKRDPDWSPYPWYY